MNLADLLRRFWNVGPCQLTPLNGGMNSTTWLVSSESSTYVAKQVCLEDLRAFASGCHVAAGLADRGFVTGRPVPTVDGNLLATEYALALLEHVPGRQLQGESDEEQRWIAELLVGVHAAGISTPALPTSSFAADWLTEDTAGVMAHPWLRPAIRAVRSETNALTLTWSVLHTDPAPEAFIHDQATATTGLIDWAGAQPGPVLYDIASAVMYMNGPIKAATFLKAYRDHGLLADEELLSLDAFRRFRWVVQAVYFAQRITEGDLTGVRDDASNQGGLREARSNLAELGLDTA